MGEKVKERHHQQRQHSLEYIKKERKRERKKKEKEGEDRKGVIESLHAMWGVD